MSKYNHDYDAVAYQFSDWALNANVLISGIPSKKAQSTVDSIWKQLGTGAAPQVVFPEIIQTQQFPVMGAYMKDYHEIGMLDHDGHLPFTVLLHELAHALVEEDEYEHSPEWCEMFVTLLLNCALVPGAKHAATFQKKSEAFLKQIQEIQHSLNQA